jgi:hypothetical protein
MVLVGTGFAALCLVLVVVQVLQFTWSMPEQLDELRQTSGAP